MTWLSNQITVMAQTTISPHNQKPFVTRSYPSETDLDGIIERSTIAQKSWSRVPIRERIDIGWKFIVSSQVGHRLELIFCRKNSRA